MKFSEITTNEPAINFPELLERVENDQDLLNDLLQMFRDEFPRQRQILEAAVQSEDMKQIYTAGHTIKGILANLAMTRAARAAARIEQAGRDENASELTMAMMKLDQEAQTIFSELDAARTDAPA